MNMHSAHKPLLMLPATLLLTILLLRSAPAVGAGGTVQSDIQDLRSGDTIARFGAATTLGALCFTGSEEAKEAVPELVRVLSTDTDAGVRGAAATALGRCNAKSKDAVAALNAALADSDPKVRRRQ